VAIFQRQNQRRKNKVDKRRKYVGKGRKYKTIKTD
jgi:hypothetical protein